MKQFKVTYAPAYDEEDLCHVSVYAENEKNAEEQAKREYHDIGTIIQVTPL